MSQTPDGKEMETPEGYRRAMRCTGNTWLFFIQEWRCVCFHPGCLDGHWVTLGGRGSLSERNARSIVDAHNTSLMRAGA